MTWGWLLTSPCTVDSYDCWPGSMAMLSTIVPPSLLNVASTTARSCCSTPVLNSSATRLYPWWCAHSAMATPSWLSDGVSRHSSGSVLVSKNVSPPGVRNGIPALVKIL